MSFATSVVSSTANPIKDFFFGLFTPKTSTTVTILGGKKKQWF